MLLNADYLSNSASPSIFSQYSKGNIVLIQMVIQFISNHTLINNGCRKNGCGRGENKSRGQGQGKEQKEYVLLPELGSLLKIKSLEAISYFPLLIEKHEIVYISLITAVYGDVMKIPPIQKQTKETDF
ncbi:hypothetical protein NPIL_437671 [Nephila pilipes]|uniref:Uncharacterized protein n=1 Tax=Nephila pilipes TaxID=299642 RepID=A0A8X6PHP4_NEPPI|nr:hypothetical protein NPIL_437671 [Nephila pilipes]